MSNKQQEIELLNLINCNITSETVGPLDISNKIDKNNKKLNLIHINIRSIRKNFDEFLSFLESFKICYCDILVLSESYQLDSFSEFSMQGYTTYYNHGGINRNDGVIILIKNNLNADVSIHHLDATKVSVIKITFEINKVTYGITGIYRSPQTSVDQFINDLNSYYSQNISENIEILVGDMNINLLDSLDQHVINYYSMLGMYGFKPYIDCITRELSGTCLDHIFIRNNLRLNNFKINTYVINYDITDHYPIMLNISQDHHNKNNLLVKKTIVNIDQMKLDQLFKQETWTGITEILDPEVSYQKFIDKFQHLFSLCKITKTVTIKQYNKIKPWITNGVITSIKKRDKLKKQLLKTCSKEKEIEYKTYRNNLKKIINNAKNTYYRRKIEENKHNLKNTYKIIAEATNENSKGKNNCFNISDNDKNFSNDKDMADFCNQYFSKVGLEMYNSIPDSNDTFQCQSVNQSIFLTPIHNSELIKHINSLKNNSAPGIDGITAKIIKQLHPYLLLPLKHIFNLIFRTGIVPKDFKISVITPILKSGNPKEICNYRPISVISNFAKLFEKCLKERLTNFLRNNYLLSENQFGFTEGRNSSDAMYYLTEEIRNNLDCDKKCLAVFLDLAKAFDTVPHQKLLDVLLNNGVRGTVLKVFENYLTGRKQQTKIGSTLSDPSIVRIGVPQGTVLGPILFNLYIKSISELNIQGKVISYADDTVAIFCGSTWQETEENAVKGIETIKKWLDIHKLSLNAKKTNYIAFSKMNVNRPPFQYIKIDNINEKIYEAKSTKYLGIIVDQFLKWDLHIEYLVKKMKFLLHKFYTLRQILDRSMLMTLYQNLIESILGYGILVWGSMYNKTLKTLQIMQNRLLKIIYKQNLRYPTNLLYDKKIVNIRTLYFCTVCSYMHKHNKIRFIVSHKHSTRNKVNQTLITPKCKSQFCQKSVGYIGPKIYNLLPVRIRQTNMRYFSKLTKDYIVENFSLFNAILS